MKTPNITVNRQWTRYTVCQACIKHDLYTCGDNEEYDHMLSWVERLYPNTENLYFIAEDIQKHSKDQTVTNVMFLLERDAVMPTFLSNIFQVIIDPQYDIRADRDDYWEAR